MQLAEPERQTLGAGVGWLQLATYPQSPFSGPARCCDVPDLDQAFSQPTGPGRLWISLGAMNELNHRGLKDILVAVIDGLKGFPEAISAVYPDCEIQTCIVHLIRNSLSFCNWKERKPVAAELKKNLQRRDS